MTVLKSLQNNLAYKIIFVLLLIAIIFKDLLYSLIDNSINNKINKNMREGMDLFISQESQDYMANNLGNIFKKSNMNFNSYPNVEIKPDRPLFTENKFLPECCFYNNQYSTDRGCPCITPEQQYYLQRNGVNKHNNDFLSNKGNYTNLFFSPTMAFKKESIPFNKNDTFPILNYPAPSDSSMNQFNNLTNNLSYTTEISSKN